MGNFLTPVLLKLDPEPSIPVVVLTGILLVFLDSDFADCDYYHSG